MSDNIISIGEGFSTEDSGKGIVHESERPKSDFTYEPYGNCIAVLMDPAPRQTGSGIEIPDNFTKIPNTGEVIAIGFGTQDKATGKLNAIPEVIIGMRVLIQSGRNEVLDWEHRLVAIVHDHQIVAYEKPNNQTKEDD